MATMEPDDAQRSCPPCVGDCGQGRRCPTGEHQFSDWSPLVNVLLILFIGGCAASFAALVALVRRLL